MADNISLAVRNLSTHFTVDGTELTAVNDVSFSVERGQVLGLVGESGSGKSVTGLSIMRLVDKPGRIAGGQIHFLGQDLLKLSEAEMRKIRGNRIAIVFQDPMMTLNPVLRIETQMVEAVLAHDPVSRQEARQRARHALGMVGIPSPEERLRCYPHEFSGGMRQRVVIAIAMINGPDVIIADEPTTALDVTTQAQILAEAQRLVANSGTSLIWITHDLSVVSNLADKVAVMYAGRLVEQGQVAHVITRPLHPYTAGLLGSLPSLNRRGQPLKQIAGLTPSLKDLPTGCSFRDRCSRADPVCSREPITVEREAAHEAYCHHPLAAEEVYW